MSRELATRVDRDLSASEETKERAERARTRGAALDVDWEMALQIYIAEANQDPNRFVRFPGLGVPLEEIRFGNPVEDMDGSMDDGRFEPASQP